MIFLVGKRTARTAHFIDTEHICYRCRAYDRDVTVSQAYFHFCLVPCFPVGPKLLEMRCRSCGDETRLDSVVSAYRLGNRPALYLFSGPILLFLLTIAWYFWHSDQQKETAAYLDQPAIGDVYTIEENTQEGTKYTFMRVAGIQRDTVLMLGNHLDYIGFVSDLADDDYFVRNDTLTFTRRKLAAMRDDEEITRIRRNPGTSSGFNRIR